MAEERSGLIIAAIVAVVGIVAITMIVEAKNDKVTICHKVPTDNPQTISVSVNSLDAHSAHGDSVGACGDSGGACAGLDGYTCEQRDGCQFCRLSNSCISDDELCGDYETCTSGAACTSDADCPGGSCATDKLGNQACLCPIGGL